MLLNTLIYTRITTRVTRIPLTRLVFRPSFRNFTSTTLLYNTHQSNPKFDNEKLKPKTEPTPIEPTPIEPVPINEPTPIEPVPIKLVDNIYTLPNIITMTRIATTPLIGYFIYTGQPNMAISLFTYSCITDFLDGFIARTFNMKSILGTILDPIADKLLLGVCTISLSLVSIMPGYVGALFIAKDAMLALMGVYYRYITLPPPKTFQRFANLSIPTVSVNPNLLSKVNTGLQMIYIGNLVFKTQIEQYISNYDMILGNFEIVVAGTTILSALSYIFSKRLIKRLDKMITKQ